MRIDERVARCFTFLRGPEFNYLLEYFRAKRQESLEMMAQVSDTDKIYRFQGEAGVYKEILDSIENAEALIAKFNAKSRP
jgi:hypothetical protein